MMTYARDHEPDVLKRLVTRARAGDREAFGDLFERFQPQIQAIALRRLGDFAEAQDTTREHMLELERQVRGQVAALHEQYKTHGGLKHGDNYYVAIDAVGEVSVRLANFTPLAPEQNLLEARKDDSDAVDGALRIAWDAWSISHGAAPQPGDQP